MKLSYQPHEQKREWITILLEGEPWREVHYTVFGRRPRFPKEVVSEESWSELFTQLEQKAARHYLLRRLASQSYHSCQLKKLLTERGVHPSTIQHLIKEFLERGYLDDQAWLESFIRSHLKRSSLRALAMKLRAKGIPSSTIQDVMEQWNNPEEEQQAIERLLKTRYRSRDLTQLKERQKVIQALLRKGYSIELIQKFFR